MAYSLVASVSATPGINGGSTGSIDTSGANLLVVHIAKFPDSTGGANGGTLSDSKSNTWTPLTSRTQPSSATSRLFYCESPNVGSGHTFTFSDNGSYPCIEALAFSGANLTLAYESENGSSASAATSLQTGSVTPSEDGSLILTGACWDGSLTGLSINSSFTIAEDDPYGAGNNMGGAAAYLIQGTAGAVNPTWSWTTSRNIATTIAVFLEEPGGGGASAVPATAALVLATFAPTVLAPRLVTPTTASLALTEFAPTVSTPVVCTPTTLALSLTEFAPTIVNPQSATPTTASLTLTTFAPTITAGGNQVATPAPATLTLTTFAPDIGGSQTVTPTTLALSLSTFAPAVSTPRVAIPTTATLSLSAFAPTILTPVVCTPITRALSLATYAPSVSNGDLEATLVDRWADVIRLNAEGGGRLTFSIE